MKRDMMKSESSHASSGFEKCPRLDLKSTGKPFQYIDADGVPRTFNSADIGAVDRSQICERFLRKAALQAKRLQVSRQHSTQRHDWDWKRLSTFQPRSILYNELSASCGWAPIGGNLLIRVRWPASEGTAAAMALVFKGLLAGGPR